MNQTNKKFVLTEIKNTKTGFIFENDKLEEIRCYESDSLIGNIYVGRVANILKNINAIFVEIGNNQTCYLPMEDYVGNTPLKMGNLIPVQIVKDQIKTKQPTVTTNISLTGQYAVVNCSGTIGVSSKIKDNSIRENLKKIFSESVLDNEMYKLGDNLTYGGIIRTNACDVDQNILVEEIKNLSLDLFKIMNKAKYSIYGVCLHKSNEAYVSDIDMMLNKDYEVITDIAKEDFPESITNNIRFYDDVIPMSSFYKLDTLLKKALNKNAYMKSGAYLVIEPTEAMTVIDVNSGKAIKGSNKEEIVYKINLEAASEIARQLKIRNLSGIIIVDFISMKSDYQNECLLNEFRKFVENDNVNVQVVDMTRLGLVEITRKKLRKPIYQIFN